jgi:flagellar motor switch protein FliN/FliY
MTPLDDTVPATPGTDLATAAATAAAAVLPATEHLAAAPPTPGSADCTAPYAGAALAVLDLPGDPRLAMLVGADLVAALAGSPLGGLDLAAAAQPALDAAAAALGTTARAAQTVDLDLVVSDLGGPFTVVALAGDAGSAGALLVPDAVLATAAGAPAGSPATTVADPAFTALPTGVQPAATAPVAGPGSRGIEMLHGVDMEVTVELGRTQMTVRELLALTPGTVLELDRAAGSPADLLVNGRLIARGEVVVVDEDFGLRVTEIIDQAAAS